MSGNLIWSKDPADIWAEGYPIGNGRLGAMVLGNVFAERIALNHDRLWRRYWKYTDIKTREIFPEFQKLCIEQKWNQAIELARPYLNPQGYGIYLNPYVPLGDLGIYPHPDPEHEIKNYYRELDLSTAIVKTAYSLGQTEFRREHLASWTAGIIAINLGADKTASINTDVSMYRLPDEECAVSGFSNGAELVMEGVFDEGVKFASVARIINSGGKVSVGIKKYQTPKGPIAPKNDRFVFGFREFNHPDEPCGISSEIEAADSVTVLIAMATDRETQSPADFCRTKLDKVNQNFHALKAEHIEDHRNLYNRVSFHLGGVKDENKSTPELVDQVIKTGKAEQQILENLFNLVRYLAIAAGREAKADEVYKAPINLSGIWNEDPRPVWDSDYHLDLNLQMCYWGLGMVNLPELGNPLVDWAYDLLPQARQNAHDMYGLEGAFFSPVCDSETMGNMDDLCFLATGTNAWLAQSLWQVWEYNNDYDQLKEKIYPALRQIGTFFENFLYEDSQGRLLTAPSGSPENTPVGRCMNTMLSVTSTFDLELIRELFENLIEASELLNVDADKHELWNGILQKLPLPTLNEEGRLLEWFEEDYETVDPGHRHRSHFVGIAPGQRITAEDTPEYSKGVEMALELRNSFAGKGSCAVDVATDAQIYARLYDSEKACKKVTDILLNHAMGNLLMCLCDWRPKSGLPWFGDRRVYQIESSLGIMTAITEMIIQDRRGLIRLLPALPRDWPAGELKGILCRGGFEVDIEWEDGKLRQAVIKSRLGKPCHVKLFSCPETVTLKQNNSPDIIKCNQGNINFPTITGGIYSLTI